MNTFQTFVCLLIIDFVSTASDIVAKTATKVEIPRFSFFICHYVFSKSWYGYHSNNIIDTSYVLQL